MTCPTPLRRRLLAQDLPRLDRRPMLCAAVQLPLLEQILLGVDVQHAEDLLPEPAVAEVDVLGHRARSRQRLSVRHRGERHPRRDLDRGEECRELDLPDTVAAEAPGARTGEAGEAAGRDQDLARDLEHRGAGPAVLEEDRDQLGVGQSLGAVAEEALPWALVQG